MRKGQATFSSLKMEHRPLAAPEHARAVQAEPHRHQETTPSRSFPGATVWRPLKVSTFPLTRQSHRTPQERVHRTYLEQDKRTMGNQGRPRATPGVCPVRPQASRHREACNWGLRSTVSQRAPGRAHKEEHASLAPGGGRCRRWPLALGLVSPV